MNQAVTDMHIGEKRIPATYRDYFVDSHTYYLKGFQENIDYLNNWFKQKPDVKSRIEQGDY